MAFCSNCGTALAGHFAFCPTCGTPAVPPVPVVPQPYYLPPKKDHTLLIVAILLLVLILPAVLAGILYVLVSGLIQSPPALPARPTVTLVPTARNGTSVYLLVTGAQPAVAATSFFVNLVVNGSSGFARPIATPQGTPTYVTIGAATYTVTWVDPGGSGTVVQGTEFVVGYPTGFYAPAPGTTIVFLLLWQDGSEITETGWLA